MTKEGSITLRLKENSHPILYEINTRVFLRELSSKVEKRITLATIPDEILDEWADRGFDAIWLMGVWTTGAIGLEIARSHEGLRTEFQNALPDVTDEDIIGSPYAVKSYTVARELGGAMSLATLRRRLRSRGIGIVLDFVSNHTARDHSWVSSHPDYYMLGSEEEKNDTHAFFVNKGKNGSHVIAFGKDPYFPGWTDTAQLNFRNPSLRKAVTSQLKRIASMCDGIRCDMAMLLLNDVIQKTWGGRGWAASGESVQSEFWSDCISEVRIDSPDFIFIAEAYWDLEWQLQQLGFDYTYDKKLCDRLLREGAGSVYQYLKADSSFQKKLLRFLENHDEVRAASALPSDAWNASAALITSTLPGMLMLHDGQLEGRKVKVPVQLGRRPAEPASENLQLFFNKLLSSIKSPVFKSGDWRLLHVKPAWGDNHSWQNIIPFWWDDHSGEKRMVVVNYAPHKSQCYVDLLLDSFKNQTIEFHDLLGDAIFVRERAGLSSKGMYFDLPGYGFHLFKIIPR